MHGHKKDRHMWHCEFCATELANDATFCWHCGRAPTSSTEALTGISSSPAVNPAVEEVTAAANLSIRSLPAQAYLTEQIQEQNAVTTTSTAEKLTLSHTQPVRENQVTASESTDEGEKEEKRLRIAMPGLSLSLPDKVITQSPGADVPVVQGTPQFKGVPFVQGAPKTAHTPHMPTIPQWQISRLPTYPSVPAVPHAAPTQPETQHGTLSP